METIFDIIKKVATEHEAIVICTEEAKQKAIGHVHCPVNGWDCPYYKDSCCTLYPEYNPAVECDDFATFWEVDEDFVCYDEHEKGEN